MPERPLIGEYDIYYEKYIGLVSEGNVIERLKEQILVSVNLLDTLTETQANHKYAPDKWSIKQVFGHLADTERIMSYRLLRIARGDATPLAGYDDEAYVKSASFATHSIQQLQADYLAVRHATISLCNGMEESAWLREGIANSSRVTARALAYIIAGHEIHHLNIIQERYLK
ncbi:DinB family protein [Paenibacillus sp. ACRRX]|uniref:DinB family protein n=1 Tax=Paenibacillus sp. ACRRX TaxID=2918206 RepID=UPI001EF6C1C2|nr:DinB family protein [Paenibacillus sp. ACRRX]MCG7407342.1 DinB family protein [Paenibacillus sp. ACRRX]